MKRDRIAARYRSVARRPGAGVPAALALAIAMLPVDGVAQGFWQVPKADQRPPGLRVEPARALFSTDPAEPDRGFGEPPAVVGLPGSRLGIAMTRKDGRPSFDGLAYQAAPNVRISADGDFDFDDGELSGQVKLQFDF